jgi:membrane protease YdiL (CAAX protease family)
MKKLIVPVSITALLWFFMFSPWTKSYINFWLGMAIAGGILSAMALFTDKKYLKEIYVFKFEHIFIGIISAIILYFIFCLGNYFSQLLFSFAGSQIEGVYSNKVQANHIIISLLLLFWIGPAEEIFWRGFVQFNLNKKYGQWKGVLFASLIYALVHIWSFNFMLIMAALVCGLFWGLLFNRYKSLVPVIISHAIWDFIIFIFMPINIT